LKKFLIFKRNMKKHKRLKIGIFCSVEFSVPPSLRMKDIHAPLWLTHFITEELVKRGYDVTLFASSDSKTKARLISEGIISLPRNKKLSDIYQQIVKIKSQQLFEKMTLRRETINFYEFLLGCKIVKMALKKKFDILWIEGKKILPLAALCPIPSVIVINGPVDKTKVYLEEYRRRYPQVHFIAISKSQTKPAPGLFTEVAYHGIKIENFPFNPKPEEYLLFSGQIIHKKGVHLAIQVAKKAKKRLMIIGRHTEDPYWLKEIKPNLNKNIEYKGFFPYLKVGSVYKDAKALLMPILWEEPFGLVMIESMACGTPVIAFDRGSVREIVKDKETGFIVKTPNEMIKAVKKLYQMPDSEYKKMRENCRKHTEKNFTIEKMADRYEEIFRKILEKKK